MGPGSGFGSGASARASSEWRVFLVPIWKLVVDKERHWNSGSMDGIRGSGFNPRPNTDSQTGIQNQTGFNEAFHLHLNLQLS